MYTYNYMSNFNCVYIQVILIVFTYNYTSNYNCVYIKLYEYFKVLYLILLSIYLFCFN